jgi:hypothetical protein
MKITFKLNQEVFIPKSVIRDAPEQGRFDEYAEWILENYRVEVSLEDSIKCLKGYGAWNESELQDLNANKSRLLWIACLDCKENKTCFWYMGE